VEFSENGKDADSAIFRGFEDDNSARTKLQPGEDTFNKADPNLRLMNNRSLRPPVNLR
jgi:hypothetical protein